MLPLEVGTAFLGGSCSPLAELTLPKLAGWGLWGWQEPGLRAGREDHPLLIPPAAPGVTEINPAYRKGSALLLHDADSLTAVALGWSIFQPQLDLGDEVLGLLKDQKKS